MGWDGLGRDAARWGGGLVGWYGLERDAARWRGEGVGLNSLRDGYGKGNLVGQLGRAPRIGVRRGQLLK